MPTLDILSHICSLSSKNTDEYFVDPTTGKERAYIILNANKPLPNQIFTAAHEFYHYVKDYQKFKEAPYAMRSSSRNSKTGDGWHKSRGHNDDCPVRYCLDSFFYYSWYRNDFRISVKGDC